MLVPGMTGDVAFVPLDPRGTILGDEVYAVLGEAILDGRLKPGERLRDVELAAHLGVSRTPVREALQRLERNGLVEVSANRWTRVSAPDAKQLTDTHEFVAYTMGYTARIALPRCTDEQLSKALHLVDEIIAASEDDDVIGALHRTARFFQFLVVATGNTLLLTVLKEADITLRRNLAGWQSLSTDAAHRTAGYIRLRAAIEARDGDAAERILRELHGVA